MSTLSHMRATRRERVAVSQASSSCGESGHRNNMPKRGAFGLARLAVLCAVALAFVLQGMPVSALTTVARAAESQEAGQGSAVAGRASGAKAGSSENAAVAESGVATEADSSANNGADEDAADAATTDEAAVTDSDQEDTIASGDASSAQTADAASAAAPAALTGAGTQAVPYKVATAEDLTAALAAAKADDDTYIALKGDDNGTLDLGANTYELKDGQHVTIRDAGTTVSITRSTTDQKTPLITVNDGASLTVTTSTG